MKKLAIVDWGIGGISIYKLVKAEIDVPVLYFSDTGSTPYGKMSRPDLVSRLNSVIAFLQSRAVTHIVVGCNAASTALAHLGNHGVEIEGMIDNAIALTIKQKPERLGLVGGRRTVLSGVYRKGFAQFGIKVEQRIAQPLSGLIESGDISSEKLRREAHRILFPIRRCSHILLACTHYPAITPLLRQLVSPKTEFIDPAGSLVEKISGWRIDKQGEDEFLTSGDPDLMKLSARLAFGVEIKSISGVAI